MSRPRILIVEDDLEWQEIYLRLLGQADYDVVATRKLGQALTLLDERPFDVIITDLEMIADKKDYTGFAVLETAKALCPDVPVIVITGKGDADHAFHALASGAYSYITKERDLRQKLVLTVQGALDARLIKQALYTREQQDDLDVASDRIIGNSAVMKGLFKRIAQVAENSLPVLIQGEKGTGKRLMAQMIHLQSPRKKEAFFAVDCADPSERLVEIELFGHGGDTRYEALQSRWGKFGQAGGGTIFLDKISSLSLRLQSRLANAIRDRLVERPGEQAPIEVAPRVIASTDKDLNALVAAGQFERSLMDTLSEMYICVPPLRDRKDGDDIPALVGMFLQRHAPGRRIAFSTEAMQLLYRYDYPGNVEELEIIVKQAMTMLRGDMIGPEHLPPEVRDYTPQTRARSERRTLQVDSIKLYELLDAYFDDSELRELCFKLCVDYDELAGTNKKDKARELISYLERRERMADLVATGHRLRPNAPWNLCYSGESHA